MSATLVLALFLLAPVTLVPADTLRSESVVTPAPGQRGPLEFHLPPGVRPSHPLAALRDTVGADVAGAGDSLVCRIRPFCSHVWPGDRPRFSVRVENRSSRTIVLVSPAMACMTRTYPQVTSWIADSAGRRRSDGWACYDPGWTPLDDRDFTTVVAGASLELYGRNGYSEPGWVNLPPGTYAERFEYSTVENDLRRWLGGQQPDTLDAAWHARLRRVPRVTLHAECGFVVQQP